MTDSSSSECEYLLDELVGAVQQIRITEHDVSVMTIEDAVESGVSYVHPEGTTREETDLRSELTELYRYHMSESIFYCHLMTAEQNILYTLVKDHVINTKNIHIASV